MKRYCRQRGASVVHWLLAIIPLLGFGALSIELNNLYGAHAELQAAADAGALEGARTIYCPGTGALNHAGCSDGSPSAPANATLAAGLNYIRGDEVASGQVTVELGHWEFRPSPSSPTVPVLGGIERGGAFTPSNNTSQTDLFYINAAGKRKPRPFTDNDPNTNLDLNSDPSWINAVRVTVDKTPVTRIGPFLGLLGIDQFQGRATSVAYATFPNRIDEAKIDFPIAMCEEVLDDSGQACTVGRLVPNPEQTGGWADLQVPEGECQGAVDASQETGVRGLVARTQLCGGSGGINPVAITLGTNIRVSNGQIQSAFDDAYDCWKNNASLDSNGDGWPDRPITMTMAVVEGCSFGGQCAAVIGAVEVDLLWMFSQNPTATGSGTNSLSNTAPRAMTVPNIPEYPNGSWVNTSADGVTRWDSFVNHFNIRIDAATRATVANEGNLQKTMYFRPQCRPVQLSGSSTVNYYGNLTAVPVLVY